ncbi:MAG: delta-60 repeat domain-containing protein [Acidimicrobiia bacterium]|nr:delta-60 repeat domain-containing protein [Acidimicrobiia bacterium]
MTARLFRSRLALGWLVALLVASSVVVGVSPVGVDGFAPAPADAAAAIVPPVEPWMDVANLNPVPERMWGVSGQNPEATQTPSLDVLVWDMVQIGDRMFVGGGFLYVQEDKDATPIRQSFVAAFDVRTGAWIDTWRPTFDRIVYSLADFNGKLLVGGEFEFVNGESRTGLVALDPASGAIDPTFAGYVERPWSDLRAMVRDIEVRGDNIYVVGNFSHLNGADGARTRVYKAARLIGGSGQVDDIWKPEVTGSGVWSVDTNSDETEVYMTGFFSAVNGEGSTGNFHTVNTTDGASVAGKIDLPRNHTASQPEMFDVAYGDDNVFVAGEQHIVQILRESDHQMLGYHTTGARNDGFDWNGGFAGGAFQSADHIGEWIVAGCHCTYSIRDGNVSHYSSYTGRRTTHRLFMIYDATTGRLHEPFEPDVHSPRDGTWAATGDPFGCLWVGGDFHVGGVDHGRSRWLGGIARFCPTDFDPDTPAPEPEPEPDPNTVIAAGSEWRYEDSGADLGVEWRNQGYDDADWPIGTAEFGFGDGDEATGWNPGHVTYYARTHFEWSGTKPDSFTLSLKADDGAVVYLNGVELARDNMPDGAITASTQAIGWKGTPEETFRDFQVPADALVEGTNVVAVETHNVWRNNADLSFDLQMTASDIEAPGIDWEFVNGGATWDYLDDATATPAGWTAGIAGGANGPAPFGFGEDYIATEVVPGNETYYFTRTFTVEDKWVGGDMTLKLLADDGAVVHMNGVEVHRYNMPEGPVDWNTRPLNWVAGADETYLRTIINGDALVAGENTIAVEVHNFWPGNSDLSFDLSLKGGDQP